MVELVQQPCEGLVVGHAPIAKEVAQYAIETGELQVFEAIGAAPQREHELADQLFGGVATVAAGSGQLRMLKCALPAKRRTFQREALMSYIALIRIHERG